MSATFSKFVNFHNWYNGISNITVTKSDSPVRFGVLGAADFSPVGLFDPVRTHPDAIVVAVAARNLAKAEKQAKAYGIARAYGSYNELLSQQDIDAVYLPLPNSLKVEWAVKAMRAGKHVLIEKPIASNADEACVIRDCAKETSRIALEAYHWQFHPAAHVVKSIIDSHRYGDIVNIKATFTSNEGLWSPEDIRFRYDLSGGSSMDYCYVFSALRYFLGAEGQYEIMKTTPRVNHKDQKIDDAMSTDMIFHPNNDNTLLQQPVRCQTCTDLAVPNVMGFIPKLFPVPTITIEFEKSILTYVGYPTPWFWHKITIKDKACGVSQTQKHYSFGPKWGARSEPWWNTYRYQLEAFVGKVRGEQNVPHWVELDESIAVMELIDKVYEESGLGRRGESESE